MNVPVARKGIRGCEVLLRFRLFASVIMASKLIKAPTVKFNNGIEFPIFGLGTWKVRHLFSV
jgi:hypothetical protein